MKYQKEYNQINFIISFNFLDLLIQSEKMLFFQFVPSSLRNVFFLYFTHSQLHANNNFYNIQLVKGLFF